MSADNAADFPALDVASRADYRVDCYVRSAVPGALAETISEIATYLQQLCEGGYLSDSRLLRWPRECQTAAETEHGPTRHELVAEFERWADRHDCTLEPAFRREEIPPSPLSLGPDESRERIRVPIVALALYEEDDETNGETLREVVPRTKQSETGEERTDTVNDWLSAIEIRTRDEFAYTPV